MSAAISDTIDLADVARSLARGRLPLVSCTLMGGLLALLIILFAPRRFDGAASAVVRTPPDAASSLLSRVGDAAGGAAALLGGGAAGTTLETEIQILGSHAVGGAVVDSLLLQVEVRGLHPVAATSVVRATRLPGSFKHFDVHVGLENSQYRVSGDGFNARVPAGGDVATPHGVISLRAGIPSDLTLRIYDREDAIKRTATALSVGKAGGEVLRVGYRASDSVTAAAVPNAIMAIYLARRKTSDRGVNARRVEFLSAQLDSAAGQLSGAEDALRRFQEKSGVIDAPAMGKLGLERAAELRKDAGGLQVEQGALDQLLEKVTSGQSTPRELVAYPSFLRSTGINELLKQLSELETERTRLLERRLDSDPEVVALTRSIANVEGQLLPLGRSYSAALRRQRADVDGQLNAMMTALSGFPSAAESSARLLREVLRLGQVYAALQGQLVQARVSAISEGGDVRALDVAVPPKRVSFPEPILTSALGLGSGLVLGILVAIVGASHGRYVSGPHAIERAAGVPALQFDPHLPLLMSGPLGARTVLLIPLDDDTRTDAVAARIADTARARAQTATVLDLSGSLPVGGQGTQHAELLARLEHEYSVVVVRLRGLATDAAGAVLSPQRAVLLVAPPGRIVRAELTSSVETLRRLGVPCAGVVVAADERKALQLG